MWQITTRFSASRGLALAGMAILCLLVGALTPLAYAYPALTGLGYGFCFLLLGLLAYALCRLCAQVGKLAGAGAYWRRYAVVLVVGVAGACFIVSVPPAYHVMQDEADELCMALSMHANGEIATAQQGVWDRGQFFVTQTSLDKRGFFQPFLVSLVHDFTGYRVENALYLNRLLAAWALVLLFAAFRRCTGTLPAAVAVFLIAVSPLFLLTANAYGFEAVNFFFLSAFAYGVVRFVEHPGGVEEVLLVALCAALAYLRYESVAVAMAAYSVIAIFRLKEGRFHALTLGSPLLYVPYLWLLRVTAARPDVWQEVTDGLGSDFKPFGLQYLPGNGASAWAFFTDWTAQYPNNAFLLALAVLGLVVVLLRRRQLAEAKRLPQGVALLGSFVMISALVFAAILLYFWGDLTDPLVSRMSLPFLIPMGLLAGLLLFLCGRQSPLWLLLPVVCYAVHTGPAIANFRAETWDHRSGISNALQGWVETSELDWRRVLILDEKGVLFWTAHRISALRSDLDAGQVERVLLQSKAGRFEQILYLAEEFRGGGGAWVAETPLPKALGEQGEAVFRQQLSPTFRLSLYAIHPEDDSRLFREFWDRQKGRSDVQAVYSEWNEYLLRQLPSL